MKRAVIGLVLALGVAVALDIVLACRAADNHAAAALARGQLHRAESKMLDLREYACSDVAWAIVKTFESRWYWTPGRRQPLPNEVIGDLQRMERAFGSLHCMTSEDESSFSHHLELGGTRDGDAELDAALKVLGAYFPVDAVRRHHMCTTWRLPDAPPWYQKRLGSC